MSNEHVYLDEGMKRWIYATARQNHWRVARWYDLEDLIQDGFLAYQKCYVKYARLVRKRKPTKEDRRNFMALVQTTYLNYIHDLAKKRGSLHKVQEIPVTDLVHENSEMSFDDWLERQEEFQVNPDAEQQTWLSKLPTNLREIVEEALDNARKGKPVDPGAILQALHEKNRQLARELKSRQEKSIDTDSQIGQYSKSIVVRRRLKFA